MNAARTTGARRRIRLLFGENVRAGAIGLVDRIDSQSHGLFERSTQETANRVRLPAGGFLQLLERNAAGPFQQGQNLERLGATLCVGWLLHGPGSFSNTSTLGLFVAG